MRIVTRILGIGTLVSMVWVAGWGAQPPRAPSTKDFMRDKLEAAQKVLEALATEDYEAIVARSRRLSVMTQENSWRMFQNPEYDRFSLEFRRNVEAMAKAAEGRNLDGATLAYMKTTLSCVECHKFVRGKKLADVR